MRLPRADLPWLVGSVVSGGAAGPVLLMLGLTGMPVLDASLLLTSEGAFTALIAWVVFRENVDRRVTLGFVLIMLGAALLAVPAGSSGPAGSGSGSVAGSGAGAAPGRRRVRGQRRSGRRRLCSPPACSGPWTTTRPGASP